MGLIQKILGISALFGTTAASAVGLAEASASVAKSAANKILGTAVEAAAPLFAEAYGRVVTSIAEKQLERRLEDMFVPPEIREDLEKLEQAIGEIEKERQKPKVLSPEEQIKMLQKIFSKGEKKDPFEMELLDLGRNLKKRR